MRRIGFVSALVAAAGGASAVAAPAERVDALDFDNGTMLTEASESYGSGVAAWAPWRLADGSDEVGWCTLEGKPLGAIFVWEFDTPWRLDTLALSTKNLQEANYPGISARTVELFTAGPDGAWKSAGKFAIGKEERREHALPKGTQATRVKLVVLENHGHDKFTELGEVDLFGERVGRSPQRSVAGDYQTNYGPMRFVQDGGQVYGCYDWAAGATVWGTASGRIVRVTWLEPREGSEPNTGTATFAVLGDKLWGVWFRADGALAGDWVGNRVPAKEGPKCQPARKGVLGQSLKKEGRVVLYGIRFATGSDVPLPESTATLDELAAALKADAGMKVQIEGHTDALASDDVNQDLSNRRARSVVALLVKKGIDAGRLEAKGYGRTKPVADNGTSQGRALNRRVEVSVVK